MLESSGVLIIVGVLDKGIASEGELYIFSSIFIASVFRHVKSTVE